MRFELSDPGLVQVHLVLEDFEKSSMSFTRCGPGQAVQAGGATGILATF
jgi:hypothetical protein